MCTKSYSGNVKLTLGHAIAWKLTLLYKSATVTIMLVTRPISYIHSWLVLEWTSYEWRLVRTGSKHEDKEVSASEAS